MYTKGQCTHMCPPDEITMREKEKLLHPFEILTGTEKLKYPKADPTRVVKSYCRSAAGVDLTCPVRLRTPETLFKTVKYLLSYIVNDNRCNLINTYDFIADRLRCVRQDIIIQNLSPEDSIRTLEPSVSFHVLFGYRLCEERIALYDPVMNEKQLMEYLKHLLVCYDIVHNHSNLTEIMQSLRLHEKNSGSTEVNANKNKHIFYEKRPLMEALYLLVNLGDTSSLERYLNLPNIYKTEVSNIAFKISILYIHKNWVKMCKLVHGLPPLAFCAFAFNLPKIRRFTFEVMSHGFNSKNLTYPLDNIRDMLLFNCDSDLIAECCHYGIKINNNKEICFIKDSINQTIQLFPPKRLQVLDAALNEERVEVHLLGDEFK